MSVESFPAPSSAASERGLVLPSLRALRGRLPLELTRPLAWAIVAGLVLASLVLRLRGLHAYLWVDEGISVGIASHPLAHIPALLRQDGSPPLYYLLLHVWMAWRGRGEVATHELSLIFALLAVPVAYWAGGSLFGRRTGLIAAGLIAGLPYLNTYAEETRMYSLLTVVSVVVAASFIHAFVFRRRRYVPVFAVSLAMALYTHNWSLFLAAVSVVAFAACAWRIEPAERRALLRDGALAYGIVLVLFAPWLPTLAYQAGHTGAPWALPPVFWSLSQGLYALVGGRGVAMLVLLGAGSGLLALRALPVERRGQTSAAALLGLGLGTLVLAWAYAKLTPAWAPRYLAVIVGPLLLAAALGFARGGRLAMVALALTAVFWVLDPGTLSRSYKSNVGPMAAAVSRHLGSDPLVIATQPEQVPTIAYYLPRVTRFGTTLGPTPDPRVVDWRSALTRLHHASVAHTLRPLLAAVHVGQRVLLVVTVNLMKAPAYMAYITRDTRRWTRALEDDPRFREVVSTAPHQYQAGVAVRGIVFERVS